MMFASKTPRDLNHDPYPFVNGHGLRRAHNPHGTGKFAPRPEFDHVQHNEPNPLLVRLRASKRDPLGYVKSGDTSRIDVDLTGATPDHIDHARKVLTRLAALS